MNYLHRDHLQSMLASPVHMPRGATGAKIAFTGNGFKSAVGQRRASPPQDVYPNAWVWPKTRYRRYWAWFFRPFFALTYVPAPPLPKHDWWGLGHRLPGMFRAGGVTRTPEGRTMRPRTGGLFGQYTRWPVAVESWRCRVWYFHSTQPTNRLQRAWHWLLYWTTYRWLVEYNFSQQDMSVMENQRFDWKEKLSGTDAEVIQWRRLVVTKHFGGRSAEFDAPGQVEDIEGEPATDQGLMAEGDNWRRLDGARFGGGVWDVSTERSPL